MTPVPPILASVNHETLVRVYEKTNYAFLFAPVFHPGMRHVASVRKELGWRTIFNLLGPLANPVEDLIEARMIGVARRDLGLPFAEALRLSGAKKAMVVCGAEELDEISCAGQTYCWRLADRSADQRSDLSAQAAERDRDGRSVPNIEHFVLSPADFGLPTHRLSEVAPGKLPHENAEILKRLLQNQLERDDPILHFVLMNTAALFVVSGICDADSAVTVGGQVITETGPGQGRWKEGVRLARWAVESGAAWTSWTAFVNVTNGLEGSTTT